MDHTFLPANKRKRSPDGATITKAAAIQLQLITRLSTPKDERLRWPIWLTYSGYFTYLSCHPSATGRTQDKESSPAKDRRSSVVLRDQISIVLRCMKMSLSFL